MSSAITMHGIEEKDLDNIAEGLAKAFGKKVWLIDLKTKKERVIG